MAYELNDGQGSLFKNERKQADKHADYNGSIKIDGQEYWLNAWLKKSSGGKTFMSLSVKPKTAVSPEVKRVIQQGAEQYGYDDDPDTIPF